MEIDSGPAGGTRATLDDDRAYSAIVIATPQGRTGVWVTIPDEPELEGAAHGPCLYQPVPGIVPAVGDVCLVQRANGRDDWWIVQWDKASPADLATQAELDAALGAGVKVRGGLGTVTWPGGTPRSDNPVITHGLSGTPISAVAVCATSLAGGLVLPVMACFNRTVTTFSVSAVTSDGSSPAAATTALFFWLAIG